MKPKLWENKIFAATLKAVQWHSRLCVCVCVCVCVCDDRVLCGAAKGRQQVQWQPNTRAQSWGSLGCKA